MLLLLACVNTPKLADDSSASDTATTPAMGELQLSFDAAIQRNGWGSGLGRCEVKVAFTRRPLTDGKGDAPGQLWDPMNVPENDQECAITLRDPVEMQAALDAQDPPPDNWILVSSVQMGSSVQLVGSSRTVDLPAHYDEDGAFVAYEMPDCNEDTFPFNDTFDLIVPEGSAEEGIAPFTVEKVAVIGPEIALVSPSPNNEVAPLTQTDDFSITWSYADEIHTEEPLEHMTMMTLRNNFKEGVNEFEAIMCMADPSDGSLPTSVTIPASDLAQLTPNPYADGPYVLSLQLDSRTDGPEITLPWGQRIRMSSTISIDGLGELLAGG